MQGGRGRIGVVISSYMHFTSVSTRSVMNNGKKEIYIVHFLQKGKHKKKMFFGCCSSSVLKVCCHGFLAILGHVLKQEIFLVVLFSRRRLDQVKTWGLGESMIFAKNIYMYLDDLSRWMKKYARNPFCIVLPSLCIPFLCPSSYLFWSNEKLFLK